MFCVFNVKKVIMIMLCITGVIIGSFFAFNLFAANSIWVSSTSKRLLPIYSVEKIDKCVAITFDCAWGADDIPDIVNTLKKNDVFATFFTVGDWVKKYPDAVRILGEAEMEIGNHSDSHDHVNQLSYDENIQDMKKCNERIEEITSQKVRFYRGPYGEYNNTVISAAESLEMKVIQWDVDTLDYEGKTVEEMCQRIKNKIRNGSIILMHNDTKYTAIGLQTIIDTIKNEGYEIVPLAELIYWENYEINYEGRQIMK